MVNIKKVQVPYPNQKTKEHVENLSFFSGTKFKLNMFVAFLSIATSEIVSKHLNHCNLTDLELSNLKLLCLE
jgi:hypothetical protein